MSMEKLVEMDIIPSANMPANMPVNMPVMSTSQSMVTGTLDYDEGDERSVAFQHLSYLMTKCKANLRSREVPILQDLSGYIPKNCLCGIIGQSGAGKTTLLGILAGIPKAGKIYGKVAVCNKNIAFVSQTPHIAATETVKEILFFSCSVTYDGPTTGGGDDRQILPQTSDIAADPDDKKSIIIRRVGRVLETLNLTRVRDRQIRYLSGGELKRVSIAMQIMTSPDILFLDEPTSGLDTTNAYSLVQTLRRVVKTMNCSIIMSIHQPHKRICHCMDWMISLKDGMLLYQGPLEDAFKCRDMLLNELLDKYRNMKDGDDMTAYIDLALAQNLSNVYNVDLVKNNSNIDYGLLAQLIEDIMKDGHASENAADYLLETESLCGLERLQESWIEYKTQKYANFNAALNGSIEANILLQIGCLGCDVSDYCKEFARSSTYVRASRAFVGLFARTFRFYLRKWWIFLVNLIVSSLAAVVLGLIYGELTVERDDIQNRFGAFSFMCIFLGIQAVASSGTFQETRDVFIDDRNANLYNALPFMFAKTLPDLLLLRIIPTTVFGAILFSMLGFQQHTFGDFLGVVILLSCCSSLCVFAISSLMPDSYLATFVSIFVNILFLLYSGVFVQGESEWAWYVSWPTPFSFYRYAFEILMVNEFQGLNFNVGEGEIVLNGTPVQFTDELNVQLSGEFFLGFFGMDPSHVSHDWTMLVVWICIYFVITWCALEFFYKSKR